MNVYVIRSNYFDDGYFGVYSTIKRARLVLERYFAEDESIVAFEDCGNYDYMITTADGTRWRVDICWDVLDAEFESGMIREDE